ncbi:hypothetical protein GOP47_0010342 [Adiantum capillus-veneris]|uniref:HMG box domain-containing protein n=1 Tax=Adiantum capillus-veneris TaxID=13818 RepID=A0A9D4ZIN7_ADICA|nr:hypothetical protein GOP47_0010342 [Adiantum capillus-veneris]
MKGAKGKSGLSKQADETNLKKRKQTASKEGKAKKQPVSKSKKEKKDPNKPKRPPTPFFVFLEEFRKTFSANNPNVKAVSAVGKAGGDKWKSLSDAEKAPYVTKANARKVEYEKNMKAYNAKQDKASDDAEEEESDANEEEGSEEEEDDDE